MYKDFLTFTLYKNTKAMKIIYKIVEWKNGCFFNEVAKFDNESDASILFDDILKNDFLKPGIHDKWEIELQKISTNDDYTMKIEILKEETLYEEVFLDEDLKLSCAINWNGQKQTLEICQLKNL